MRSFVLRSRMNSLMKLSSIGVLGVLVAGCSSGFQRFDHYYQSALPQQNTQVSNQYPGNVDPMTTASTNNKLQPLENVAPAPVPQGVYHQAEPTYAQQGQYQPAPQPTYQAPKPYQPYASNQQTYQSLNTYQASTHTQQSSSTVSASSLPPVQKHTVAKSPAPQYTPPKPDPAPQTVYIAPKNTDAITTSTVAKSKEVEPVAANRVDQGWTSAGGTTIIARQGETLYNLSKRYGVPVDAIRQANGMTEANGLQAGQRVLIPNYVFTPTSPVSAPDNDRSTRAARASTGYVGEANPKSVPVPQNRPYRVASTNTDKMATRSTRTVEPKDTKNTSTVKTSSSGVDTQVTGSVATKAAIEAPAPERTGISNFRWPVNGKVVKKFGASTDSGKNEGIDISVPEGTAVKAAENGVVIYAGSEITSYGKLILVRHSNDWVSAYAHNKAFAVKKGDKVNRGQIIARSGRTGETDRPKLHFELRKNSIPVDPTRHLPQT